MSPYKSSPCPKSSPWGAIQDKRELAPGIWQVSTAGHGGIKLSRERNAAVPAYMRAEGGWYEEDCQWSIAAVVHPIGFTRTIKIEGKPDRTEMEIAHETLRNWFPDWFETFCGVRIEPGQSIVRDQQIFDRNNRSNYVVTAAWGDWAHWVPEGKVGVIAKRNSDHTEKWFLVDKAIYGQKFVIDLTRDTEITKPERP
ncbi:DUF7007 domain-containing protein [Bradyrhizobium elkanii]|uniref:DUF7007 domain-containing protein n=1 Tax=Bradyrhizobium elkanii TaxID=29448 RepID=A0ABV4F195_BRAEL|nr:hypothetical protein [Bradyrhizobium elkanii]MCP1757790.1 hypothetical protein [Bradyrhizobium elkanii]MCS3881913.1 hypothetical protein [Bradyrhizobium elkanii]MCS4218673.1 hypothetical protein [Bradyrhizobium elkanii]MCW2110029.1 hypothetical protein [Bradyrhizobium elkanii]MCW2201600.1 hypothetical protein [Bradyrhizobium elkanii]